jgi:outer membrane protein
MVKAKKLVYICLSSALLLSLVLAAGASAQSGKFGFVRDEHIKLSYKAWQRAQEEFELERKSWDEEAVAKQTELEELLVEYERQKLILSEEKKREREATIRTKQEALDAFTRQVYGPGGTAEKKEKELILPLIEKINEAIRIVAVEGDYDVVFTMASGLGYIRESFDLTDKVLEALEELE